MWAESMSTRHGFKQTRVGNASAFTTRVCGVHHFLCLFYLGMLIPHLQLTETALFHFRQASP